MFRLSLRTAAAAIRQKRERERSWEEAELGKEPCKKQKIRLHHRFLRKKKKQEVENKKLKRSKQDWKYCVAAEIPLDLLIEILTRLPPTSVVKLKCVSKFWSSLLSSRDFSNRFLMLPSQPRLYMTLLDRLFYSKSLLLSSAAPSPFPSTFEFDQDQTVRRMGGFDPRFLHGFICFMYYLNARIYNPSTRQLYIIPFINKKSDIIAECRDVHNDPYTIQYYMGHDTVNDQYKLLCTILIGDIGKLRQEYWVYVLEGGGSWKRKSVTNDVHPHIPNVLALCMNGAIYYCAWTDEYTCVLVRFDVRSEELDMLQVPWGDGEKVARLDKTVSQMDYAGKVAVLDITIIKETGVMYLWVVEDWRKKEWSRKNLVLKPCQMHLVTTNQLKIRGTHLKGRILLFPMGLVSPFYILCYDLQTNDLKKIEIKEIPECWFSKDEDITYFDVDFMHPSKSIRYLENEVKLFR
ncbi:hypothetical protein CARUB_v10013652mg [Capsella rubella]|uniref:F-box domain-containing protein n=1 Tax=Capsella rubella TaxID=81985 RepID=R0HLG8_9BRAS|nr:F-box only protein 8 [Capsella rubella]EOA30529.1 hypothetical protein CARUB_v10013652mg [Capsella rubella]